MSEKNPVKSLAAAKVVDGILILSLPDALNPVVWQMELGQTKSSAMEVRAQADDSFLLVLKTPLQDVQNIAIYNTRALAVAALLTISKALESAQGQINPHYAGITPYPLPAPQMPQWNYVPLWVKISRFIGKTILWIVGIAVLLFVVTFLFSRFIGGTNNTPSSPSSLSSSSSQQQNVPVSADDFLEGR